MKITVLVPKKEFTKEQQKRLSELGEIVYTDSRREYQSLLKYFSHTILSCDRMVFPYG